MKAQIVFPDSLFEELRGVVPVRKRSQFVAEAVEARLRLLKFKQALRTAAGSWKEEHHPQLKTEADVNRYLSRFRAQFRRHG